MREYASRLEHYTRFELVELPEASGKKLKPGDAKTAEAEAILGRLKPQDWLVALDERGKQLDSVELSRYLAKAQTGGSKDLLFVIGGDEGLDESVRQAAHLTLVAVADDAAAPAGAGGAHRAALPRVHHPQG